MLSIWVFLLSLTGKKIPLREHCCKCYWIIPLQDFILVESTAVLINFIQNRF